MVRYIRENLEARRSGLLWMSARAGALKAALGGKKENVLILLNYPKTSSDVIELGGLNEGCVYDTGRG